MKIGKKLNGENCSTVLSSITVLHQTVSLPMLPLVQLHDTATEG
jgi:hypothetical protein